MQNNSYYENVIINFLNELESDFTIIVFQTSHVSTSEVVAFNLCALTDSKGYTK